MQIQSTGQAAINSDDDDHNIDNFLNNIVCKVCGCSDREDQLLLCDGCDEAIHLDCHSPRLSVVPQGDYFCVNCAPDFLVCKACGDQEQGERMMICDGCETATHIFCMDPPLEKIPESYYSSGGWFCDKKRFESL